MAPPQTRPVPRTDARSPWHWLLIVPVVVPLMTFLYNGRDPTLRASRVSTGCNSPSSCSASAPPRSSTR